MKQRENFSKAHEPLPLHLDEVRVQQKANGKLVDFNSNEGLANTSFMLWAILGFSIDHSYLVIPLS